MEVLGLNNILRGLKNYTDNITAIVPVSDNETSKLNNVQNIKELEDVKESLIALAKDEEAMKGIMELKFDSGASQKISFGDIFLMVMNEYSKDFTKSIEKTKDILNMTGKVLPVTLEKMNICAELEDGTIVEGKENIPDVVNSKASKISRVYLNPSSCKPAPRSN